MADFKTSFLVEKIYIIASIILLIIAIALFNLPNKIIDVPSEGIYVLPTSSYKFWTNFTEYDENIITIPIIVQGNDIGNYKFVSLVTDDGKEIPVKRITLSDKEIMLKDTFRYMATIYFYIPPSGSTYNTFKFIKLKYISDGLIRYLGKFNITYETSLIENTDEILHPISFSKNNGEFDFRFKNATSKNILIKDIVIDLPEINITEKTIIDSNGKKFKFSAYKEYLAPDQEMEVNIKFNKIDSNLFTEISPKIVFQYKGESKVRFYSLWSDCYPGNNNLDNTLYYIKKIHN